LTNNEVVLQIVVDYIVKVVVDC